MRAKKNARGAENRRMPAVEGETQHAHTNGSVAMGDRLSILPCSTLNKIAYVLTCMIERPDNAQADKIYDLFLSGRLTLDGMCRALRDCFPEIVGGA